jgi:hypothetical protein
LQVQLEGKLRASGRGPSQPTRDTEQEAEDWMRRELPRWTYD